MSNANNTSTGTDTYNTAVGYQALRGGGALANNTGRYVTAIGDQALFTNASGDANTAIGAKALFRILQPIPALQSGLMRFIITMVMSIRPPECVHFIRTPPDLQILPMEKMHFVTTRPGTSILQPDARHLQMFPQAIRILVWANSLTVTTSGSYNTALGYNTGPDGTNYVNTTCLGIDASATGSNMVRVGNAYVGSIGGYTGWTIISDKRFNENVKEDVPGLNFINLLRPVTFQLDCEKINALNGVNERRKKIKEQNPDAEFLSGEKYSKITTGFLAQEVEAAAKSIGFDFSGVDAPKNDKDMYGLRYAEFVVPLVKAVQEQQKMIAEMQQKNEELQKQIDELKAILKK